jgi:hypothetical protein
MTVKYLVKNPYLDEAQLQHRLREVAAKIAIKYGAIRSNDPFRLSAYIEEFWTYDRYPPTCYAYHCCVQRKHIKDYIRKYISVEHPIWNADFMYGLCRCGTIRENVYSFPSFYWYYNPNIVDILHSAPFWGRHFYYEPKKFYGWCNSPSLCLEHKTDSISYMAGVLATGRHYVYRNQTYIQYTASIAKLLKQWHIPIEYQSAKGKLVLVSPFWPALFAYKMPPKLRSYFAEIPNAAEVDVYSSILWYAYMGSDFKKEKIPYLKSRRSVLYQFQHPDGTLRNLEMLRVQKRLIDIDSRVKQAMKEQALHA